MAKKKRQLGCNGSQLYPSKTAWAFFFNQNIKESWISKYDKLDLYQYLNLPPFICFYTCDKLSPLIKWNVFLSSGMNFILGMTHRTITYHEITANTIVTRLLCQHSRAFSKLKSKKNNLENRCSIS